MIKRLIRPLVCLVRHGPYTTFVGADLWCSRCSWWAGQVQW
jgi:hypothetical protein